jgi:hypothetical protein
MEPIHDLSIHLEDDVLTWTTADQRNGALSWELGSLKTGLNAPFNQIDVPLYFTRDTNGTFQTRLAGLFFNGELYTRYD